MPLKVRFRHDAELNSPTLALLPIGRFEVVEDARACELHKGKNCGGGGGFGSGGSFHASASPMRGGFSSGEVNARRGSTLSGTAPRCGGDFLRRIRQGE